MRPRLAAVGGLVSALVLSGCASTAGQASPAASSSAAVAGGFPVSVADCSGRSTTFAQAPDRIVTSNAAGLEMLLELGAGRRVIGTGFPPGQGALPVGIAAEGARVPVLGKAVIPKEKLLGSGADLYVDTFASMSAMGGGAGGAPSEQEFAAAGIRHVFLHSTACASKLTQPQRDLSLVEQDITSLGRITGTSAAAARLVAAMTAKVGAVQQAIAKVPAAQRPSYFFFDFDAGTKQPTAACNRQVANAVITSAGARNIFADCDAAFRGASWEQVVAANPDWIQLGVRNHGSQAADTAAFDQAEQFLRTFPATKDLKAVREGHLLRITSEVTTIAGVRDADTVQQIAHTLYPSLVPAGE